MAFHDLQVIDGVECSELGIPLDMGIRCPHNVMDGDKPLDPINGPRCGECRKRWQPFSEARGFHSCPRCGERLHTTHAYRADVNGYPAISWSHTAPNSFCKLLTFPVEGNEKEYLGSHGWGAWEEHATLLRRLYAESVERELRFERQLAAF